MREIIKGNVGNKVGFEINSEDMSVSALSEISQNPNAQPADRTLATQTIVEHVKVRDRIRERRAKGIDYTIKTLLIAGVLDQKIYDGKGRKTAIKLFKDSFETISKEATKLLPRMKT